MMRRLSGPGLFLVFLTALVAPAQAKSQSSIYTREKIENARQNIALHAWARAERDRVAGLADQWLRYSDEQIWNLPVEQTVPRSNFVNKKLGCPIHGQEIHTRFGAYGGWKVDPLNKPWKLQCPIGGETWPTNDFAKYYASGKDGKHIFQYSRANGSLLYSTDAQRKYGVDNGQGYVDGRGNRFNFVAYYAHWAAWQNIGRSWSQALLNLGEAYAMTGDTRYSRKAAILLSRIADLLPSMDTAYWSARGYEQGDGMSNRGVAMGSIWDSQLASAVARAYDAIYPGIQHDPALYSFLHAKAVKHGLAAVDTPAKLTAHIEYRAIGTLLSAIQQRRIRGNEGVHQRGYAELALALDHSVNTPKWLDWLNLPGTMREGAGHLPAIFVDWIDRDGAGDEASPGYNDHWLEALQPLADLLEDSPYAGSHSLTRYPNFRKFLSFPYWLQLVPDFFPHIGDVAATGDPGGLAGNQPGRYAAAFQRYGYPELAQMAYALNGNRASGLHGSIWEQSSERTANEIEKVIAKRGALKRGPLILPAYGLASLSGKTGPHESAVWMYSGRMDKHGHWDRLNLGMFAYGIDILPDLGYPDFPTVDSPNYWGWLNNTAAHNTVVVNARRQTTVAAGSTRAFLADYPVQVMEVDGNGVYPETELYRRSVIQVPAGDSFYVVDLFRVKGGNDHLYSFHAGPGAISYGALKPVLQNGGTYAGPGVAFGQFYDGACCTKYMGSGFQFFDSVYHDPAPPETWHVEWKVTDHWNVLAEPQDTRLRLWSVGDKASSVAIVRGHPPANIPGNPKTLRYLLERRMGAAPLVSNFIHVIEPHLNDAKVLSVERFTPVPPTDSQGFDRVGLKITLADGRVDYIVHGITAGEVNIEGIGLSVTNGTQPTFNVRGRGAVISWREGEVETAHLFSGEHIDVPGQGMLLGSGIWTGKVEAVDTSKSDDVRLRLSSRPPAGNWTGRYIRISRPGGHNPFYRIEGLEVSADAAVVHLGRVNLVRGHVDLMDYQKGQLRDIHPGDAFEVQTDAYGKPGAEPEPLEVEDDGAEDAAVAPVMAASIAGGTFGMLGCGSAGRDAPLGLLIALGLVILVRRWKRS